MSQPFFGDEGRALEFARAVASSGFLTGLGTSVFDFAFSNDLFEVNTVVINYPSLFIENSTFSVVTGSTFATVTPSTTPVPLPAGGLLLLTGLAGVAAVKRRSNRAA